MSCIRMDGWGWARGAGREGDQAGCDTSKVPQRATVSQRPRTNSGRLYGGAHTVTGVDKSKTCRDTLETEGSHWGGSSLKGGRLKSRGFSSSLTS